MLVAVALKLVEAGEKPQENVECLFETVSHEHWDDDVWMITIVLTEWLYRWARFASPIKTVVCIYNKHILFATLATFTLGMSKHNILFSPVYTAQQPTVCHTANWVQEPSNEERGGPWRLAFYCFIQILEDHNRQQLYYFTFSCTVLSAFFSCFLYFTNTCVLPEW